MNNDLTNLYDHPVIYFSAISVVIIATGAYGIWLIYNLKNNFKSKPNGQQVDKLLIASANLAISIISICVIIMTQIQMDTNKVYEEILSKLK